jgi:hypothetical protein
MAQAAGLRHQHGDVVAAVDERRTPAASAGDKPWWWHFGASVDAGHVSSEAASDRHPPRRHTAGRVDVGTLRPGQCRSDGDCGQTGRVQNSNKPG